MKSIVLFGAGKSASSLILYLTRICSERSWTLTVADSDLETLKKKLPVSPQVFPVQADVQNSPQRTDLIQKADLVISLLPTALHILVARDCVANAKNLLTASYVDDEIRGLSDEIKGKKLFFLCEMGLDPGIDHMSAMQLIHRIQAEGGIIHTFRSHTGGLVAPESDDNPWHYKISWNPANVVRAGSLGCVFKEDNKIKTIAYKELFKNPGQVDIHPLGRYAYYPNRDSLAYIPVYGLETAHTFIRTTLRHPDFCFGWKNIVSAGLTDDQLPIGPAVQTIAQWSAPLLPFTDDANKPLYESLGLFENTALPPVVRRSAKVLQAILENKWKMNASDQDMIVMLHEFEYEIGDQKHYLRSRLIVKGENAQHTAMAKTVGLHLGIAAKLIIENKMLLEGLCILIIPQIYEAVLEELALEGIRFEEEIS